MAEAEGDTTGTVFTMYIIVMSEWAEQLLGAGMGTKEWERKAS